jgi:hypothetical protein
MIASWLALTLAEPIEAVRNAVLMPRFSNADDPRRQRHKIQIAAGTVWVVIILARVLVTNG